MIKKVENMICEHRQNVRGGMGPVDLINIFDRTELSGMARLARLVLGPGCSVGKHYHMEDYEVYYIMRGTAEADDNGDIIQLYEGDAFITENGGYHSVMNNGESPLEILAVVLPK